MATVSAEKPIWVPLGKLNPKLAAAQRAYVECAKKATTLKMAFETALVEQARADKIIAVDQTIRVSARFGFDNMGAAVVALDPNATAGKKESTKALFG